MWYSQMVTAEGLLPALCGAALHRPSKLICPITSNQPLTLLRLPSPRDNHMHSSTTGSRLVAVGRQLP